ncbi:MAG: hypothetical protein D6768_09260 [Chloroflexi bacterium]|nr:MAG: hypothetical protein D6768_09260 [Chloroflexota bacterium]
MENQFITWTILLNCGSPAATGVRDRRDEFEKDRAGSASKKVQIRSNVVRYSSDKFAPGALRNPFPCIRLNSFRLILRPAINL